MKPRVLMRQVQQAPGLVNRLLASANVDCTPAVLFTDGRARGMATGADIMCGSTKQRHEKKTSIDTAVAVSKSTSAADAAAEQAVRAVAVPQKSTCSSPQPKWWRPDPVTGTWVPEGQEGQLTTSTDASSRVMHVRSETTASVEDKRWWISMEELPDMDRANPK